jgi:hypothetical protein
VPVGVDGLLLGGEPAAALDRGREVVGLDHVFEHLLLEDFDPFCAVSISCWIVWYSCGLHLHQLVAELERRPR